MYVFAVMLVTRWLLSISEFLGFEDIFYQLADVKVGGF